MVSELVKDEEQKRIREGLDFNFFSLYDMERCEEETHQKMLYFMLSRIGDRAVRHMFMQRLVDIVGLPGAYRDIMWEVDKEHSAADGRMDLFLYSKKEHICVIIELKIDAPDQERQLEKYRDYVKNCHYADYRIVYLTLDGRAPSGQSVGSTDEDKLICASFTGHIVEWLETCIAICGEYGIEASLITQYKLLLIKLRGENNMNEKIREIIGSDEGRLKACLSIANALSDVKADVLYQFLSEIQKAFKRKRLKIVRSGIEDAKEYYSGNRMIPSFLIEICAFQTSAYGTVKLCMGLEVDYRLNRYIGFYRSDDMEIIPSDKFAEKQKRIAGRVINAVQECLNVEVRENNYDSIWWERISDMDGDTYDFKHFSANCTKLVNPELRHKEVERIAQMCTADCRNLKRAVS